jgi:type I restriction enzyme, S subunit
MNHWKMATLGDLVEPADTWNPTKVASNEVFDYIDLSAVDQETKLIRGAQKLVGAEAPSRARQLVAKGDVLVSTVRPNLNGVARITEEFDRATASTGFCVLRARSTVLDSGYLFHWVKSPLFVSDMVRKATGASYPAVSDRIIFESRLPLPPLVEQRRIAKLLDRAEALRTTRRATISRLDTLPQSIFLDLFGDPATNPKGWQRAKLGDGVFSASDGPHVSPTYSDDGIPFISTRHVREGEISWEDLKFISQEDAEIHWRKCKPEFGDVLYTKGGTTGLAVAVETKKPFALWVHVALLKPNPTKVDSIWLESMLNTRFCYRQSQELTHGIANRDLGLTRMVKIDIFLPPLTLQQEFARRIASLKKMRTAYRASLAEMDVLFASFQHRAFRGEL